MYSNDYIGRPEEPFFHREPDELTDVGAIVEKWRAHANMTVEELVEEANEYNPLYDQRITIRDYWSFVRGKRRITNYQLRTVAKALKTTLHILTHYPPGQVPKDERPSKRSNAVIAVVKPTILRRPAKKTERSYDPDEAARLLAGKFSKVTRLKH
jgi:hypothetical protein